MNADREPNRLPLRAGAMLLLAIAVACIGLGAHDLATRDDDPDKALDQVATSTPTPGGSSTPTSTTSSATDVRLCVFNAGSVSGLAREVTNDLKTKGYTLASPQNLTTSSFSENTVFYDTDGDAGNTKSEAEKAAKDVPGGASVEERPSSFTQCASGIPVIMVSRS
ncbi:LytR C-terminal domain-containing protein [Gordonia sp. CPCC 205333]|uniref:LytR C-terminal domain-containing protein n=1 Tax=Gordonia sp. CPCC 205333 TaxID=3140790 RepID=UPI003AF3FDD8